MRQRVRALLNERLGLRLPESVLKRGSLRCARCVNWNFRGRTTGGAMEKTIEESLPRNP